MADWRNMIPHTRQWEGGISDKTTDRASKDPIPGTFMVRGRRYVNPHTSKGVTWTTFKAYASVLGYQPTPELFFQMPENIWLQIFKRAYWDKVQASDSNSEAIAQIITQWAWGSGVGGWYAPKKMYVGALGLMRAYLKTKGYVVSDWDTAVNRLNDLVKKQGERRIVDELFAVRKKFLLDIPGDANDEGWMNRHKDFYEHVARYIKENPGPSTGIAAAIAIGVLAAILIQ